MLKTQGSQGYQSSGSHLLLGVVMLETSQSLIRAMALAALTAVFAGVWQNDRPSDPTLAVRLPADQRSFVLKHEPTAPVFKLSQPRTTLVQRMTPRATPMAQTVPVSTGAVTRGFTRNITTETIELLISSDELSSHLNQLPLGIPAGDYRIVDSLGGVGWLHVTDSSRTSFESPAADILTTQVGEQSVRFIPVQQTRSASEKSRTIR